MAVQPKGIGKSSLYELITGYSQFEDHPRVTQFTGHPVGLDVRHESIRDKAYILVKKMQMQYKDRETLGPYYAPFFEKIEKAYLEDDSEKFKDSLQGLIDAIYSE